MWFEYPDASGFTISFEILSLTTSATESESALTIIGETAIFAPTQCSQKGTVPVGIVFKDSTNVNGYTCIVNESEGIELIFEAVNSAPSYGSGVEDKEYEINAEDPETLELVLDYFTDADPLDVLVHRLYINGDSDLSNFPFVSSVGVGATGWVV